MYMRQYAWRIIRISKEILQIFSHYFAESATRRRLPQAISKTCGDAPTRRRQKTPQKNGSWANVLVRAMTNCRTFMGVSAGIRAVLTIRSRGGCERWKKLGLERSL